MTRGERPAADRRRRVAAHAGGGARRDAGDVGPSCSTHLPDVGDLATQRPLDAWVEQAADALRALSEAARGAPARPRPRGHPDAVTPPYAADGIASPRTPVGARRVRREPPHRRPGLGVGARRCAAHRRPARLADLVIDLDAAARRAAARAGGSTRTGHERCLVDRAATELDRVGGLLQSWTATAVEAAARVRAPRAGPGPCDLVVEGQLVVESLAARAASTPGERLASGERLQELLNRVTAVRARELARLGRELEHVARRPRGALRSRPVGHLTPPAPGACPVYGVLVGRDGGAIACRP